MNKNKLDYTLEYLRFLSGYRSSPPAARQYGLSPDAAQEKRNVVDACLRKGVRDNAAH